MVNGTLVAGGTGVITGLNIGAAQHMTVTENGAGDYTFTLNVAGQRFLGLQASSRAVLGVCSIVEVVDGSSFRVRQTTASTGAALADSNFSMTVAVQYAEDES